MRNCDAWEVAKSCCVKFGDFWYFYRCKCLKSHVAKNIFVPKCRSVMISSEIRKNSIHPNVLYRWYRKFDVLWGITMRFLKLHIDWQNVVFSVRCHTCNVFPPFSMSMPKWKQTRSIFYSCRYNQLSTDYSFFHFWWATINLCHDFV